MTSLIVNHLPLVGILAILPVATLLVVTSNLLRRLLYRAFLPSNLPWAGHEAFPGPFGRAKANSRSFFDLRNLLNEGYEKFSKKGQAYVLPYFLNGHQVVLPRSQIRWLLDQPDSVLSQDRVNRQFLEAEHTFLHASLVNDPVHPEIIRHELTKKINTFSDDIVDEIEAALEASWGSSTEWHEVKVYDTMLDVVARLSTRVFMGLPLCRDPEFLQACKTFNRTVAVSAAILSILPNFLKPIVAPIVTLYDRMQYLKGSKFMMPIIKQRLGQLASEADVPLLDSPLPGVPGLDVKIPNDYVQWAIQHAMSKPTINPLELDPKIIACRFSVLSFAAIQSSVITLTNTLFDLAASPDCDASFASMRKEVMHETAPCSRTSSGMRGRDWTKATLARLIHVDSAIRESLRLNGFIERGIMKMVVAPEGVVLPDGSHIPYGTKVGVSGYSIHHDNDIYEDAMAYKPFRFVQSGSSNSPQALVTTSETFLGFSHGSHACPGRFFAANQLKIALAHIALHYQVEPIQCRPLNKWFFGHIAPPMAEALRVRRRS